ncbi:PREDICTED: uncharacterized protein LOC109580431 [Amphimedon queenslandica]|uniref:Immunoglobulin subtype domain-containing protein n=1 Tax=Amphimedon queenslandica TaxID=400682 RepID=A0AAN0IXD1_AMPQE|nr:PREDICTED: uncharacterized protein LOC109580431 [Amphimedon queenslandica]|eukprot:XP_019849106.1 PREDICTED: uncharacterized protein LOC109580431 [Amphimedon queenslandica]
MSLGCLLLLCLVTQSFSLCVFRNGRCTNPSLILMSQDDSSNGFDLTIKELPLVSTNISITPECTATMGIKKISCKFNESDNSMMMVSTDETLSSALYDISISLDVYDQKCCDVSANMTHNITLEVIDNPHLQTETNDPHTLHCSWSSKIPNLNFLIAFLLNGNTIGYCGQFTTSPMEHINDITIYYDKVCTIRINKLTSKNKGRYSCLLMIPNPDDNGYLKFYSESTELSPNKEHIYQIVLGIIGAIIFVGIICLITYCCYRKFFKNERERDNEQGAGEPLLPDREPG